KTASEAVDAKRLALKLADLELTSVQSAVKDPAKPTDAEAEANRQAQLARDKAAAELEAAQTVLASKQAAVGGANEPITPSSKSKEKFQTFWGPVIYEIRDSGSRVNLVAVQWREAPPAPSAESHQQQLQTANLTPPVKGEAPGRAAV